MEKRYKTLRWLSYALKSSGVFTLVSTALAFLFIALSPLLGAKVDLELFGGSIILALGGLISGIATAVFLFGVGEVLDLGINIEENTRATGIALNKLLSRQAPRPTPPVPAPPPNPDSLLNRARQNEP